MPYKYLCPFFCVTYVHPFCDISTYPNSSCPSWNNLMKLFNVPTRTCCVCPFSSTWFIYWVRERWAKKRLARRCSWTLPLNFSISRLYQCLILYLCRGGGEGVKSSGQRNGSALYKSYINFVELIKNDRDGTNCDETRHLRNSLLCFVSLNVFSNPVTGRDLKVIMKVKSYSFVW